VALWLRGGCVGLRAIFGPSAWAGRCLDAQSESPTPTWSVGWSGGPRSSSVASTGPCRRPVMPWPFP